MGDEADDLIVKPTKCDKCGDDGDGPILYVGKESHKSHCHCRTDPKSLWYFVNVIMKEND